MGIFTTWEGKSSVLIDDEMPFREMERDNILFDNIFSGYLTNFNFLNSSDRETEGKIKKSIITSLQQFVLLIILLHDRNGAFNYFKNI